MTRRIKVNQRAGTSKVVWLNVKPRFRDRVINYSKKPGKRKLLVEQVVKAKKYRNGKKQRISHRYRVRSSR